MMAFSEDGQADPLVIAKRDAEYGTNSKEREEHRAKNLDFSYQPSKAADHWLQGQGAYQLETVKKIFKSGMLQAFGSCTLTRNSLDCKRTRNVSVSSSLLQSTLHCLFRLASAAVCCTAGLVPC